MARNLLSITTDPKYTIKNFKVKCKEQTQLNMGTISDAIYYSEDKDTNIHYILSD